MGVLLPPPHIRYRESEETAEEEEEKKDTCYHFQVELLRTDYGQTLVIDGNVQFTEKDEYIYHEALVHPAMAVAKDPETVLIIGGGDGLALREVLKWKSVKKVYLVDIDPCVVKLGMGKLRGLNNGAFLDPRVEVVIGDGKEFLEKRDVKFDVIIIDSTDPGGDVSSGGLFTESFYQLVKSRLNKVMVTNAGKYGSEEFQRVYYTVSRVFPYAKGYYVNVPSFNGEWGFVIASTSPLLVGYVNLPEGVKYVNGDFLYLVTQGVSLPNTQRAISESDPVPLKYFSGVELEDGERLIKAFNLPSYTIGVTNKRVIIGEKETGKARVIVPDKVKSVVERRSTSVTRVIVALAAVTFYILFLSIDASGIDVSLTELMGVASLLAVIFISLGLISTKKVRYTEINDMALIPDEHEEIYKAIKEVFKL